MSGLTQEVPPIPTLSPEDADNQFLRRCAPSKH